MLGKFVLARHGVGARYRTECPTTLHASRCGTTALDPRVRNDVEVAFTTAGFRARGDRHGPAIEDRYATARLRHDVLGPRAHRWGRIVYFWSGLSGPVLVARASSVREIEVIHAKVWPLELRIIATTRCH